MRFASFVVDGRVTWGGVRGDVIADLGAALPQFPNLRSYLEAGGPGLTDEAWELAPKHPVDGLTWLPVIPEPQKILCVGLNYEMHRLETGRTEVKHPTIFARYANSQIGHLAPIVRPRVSDHLDFEGELAVVIGKAGRHIDRARAMEHVAGYSCYNDASVRDFQAHTHQFIPGKNFPGTGAFGPWMVTPDEVPGFENRKIRTRLNGTVVQEAAFGQMIFDIPAILEYCSTFTRLEPGDVIATGTPGGVGAKRTPPLWMKPGDLVEVEIDGVGTLRNPVMQEPDGN